MKRCPKCGLSKPREDFFRNAARYDGLSGYCRPCQTVTNRAGKIALRERCFDLLGRTCKDCGHADIRVLTFDHINGGGTQHRREVGPHKIMLDVLANPAKYQVLCWNCNFLKKLENGEHGRRFLGETVTL